MKSRITTYPRIQYITQDLPDKSHAALCLEACEAGVKWVQLRIKKGDASYIQQQIKECQDICKSFDAIFIVNDYAEIAMQLDADGIHLGLQDKSTSSMREEAPPHFIIGGTANRFEDIVKHYHAGVQYIGLGPLKYTATKEKLSPILGQEGYRQLLKQCRQHQIKCPIYAIGGITVDDIPELIQNGIYGVAVSGLITHAPDKKEMIQRMEAAMII